MFGLDRIVRIDRIFHVTRTVSGSQPSSTGISPETGGGPSTVSKAGIIADFRTSMGELKCLGSERLVRLGISMSQLHVMHLLELHGEMAMSRLAEMLDVSVSNATGLIDRVEDRGYVERIRVPSDRRVVLVRITAEGRAVLDEVEAVREEILERILGELDPAQLSRLAAAMGDLRSALATSVGQAGTHQSHQTHGRD
jgi:DNA-binding MarR family transcriptional regulator